MRKPLGFLMFSGGTDKQHCNELSMFCKSSQKLRRESKITTRCFWYDCLTALLTVLAKHFTLDVSQSYEYGG